MPIYSPICKPFPIYKNCPQNFLIRINASDSRIYNFKCITFTYCIIDYNCRQAYYFFTKDMTMILGIAAVSATIIGMVVK
jgi:hypothetical protein